MIGRSNAARAFAAAAMTGLMAGTVSSLTGCQNKPAETNPGVTSSTSPSTESTAMAKHDCKGQNACKGQGGCNTGDNGCKGKNSCKGKGGCSTNKE